MLGLYIHVPFCRKRCVYCSFYSTTCGKRERDLYVDALKEEMRQRAAEQRLREGKDERPEVATLYFGGGTPSQLDADELRAVFEALHAHFRVVEGAEITFECNPDDVAAKFLHDGDASNVLLADETASAADADGIVDTGLAALLASLGVNRVSMGVQSFRDDILRTINRRHTAVQARAAIEILHDAGIHNISIDLIYGLPGQDLATWRSDVDAAVALATHSRDGRPAVTHLSSYALSIEEGTPLYNMRAQGKVAEVDDETSLAMYNYLVDSLRRAGFEHYEISNFALPGYRSRHNSSYWRQTPYIGLGPGAHSYDGASTRRHNHPSLEQYIAAPHAAYGEEHLSSSERYDELIMTRLRTSDGLPLSLLGESARRYLLRQARPYLRQGHLSEEGGGEGEVMRLTRSGIFISDLIFSDLMSEE